MAGQSINKRLERLAAGLGARDPKENVSAEQLSAKLWKTVQLCYEAGYTTEDNKASADCPEEWRSRAILSGILVQRIQDYEHAQAT